MPEFGKRKDNRFYKKGPKGVSSDSIESGNIHHRLSSDSQAKMILISNDLDSAKHWERLNESQRKLIAEQIRTNEKEINKMSKSSFMDLSLIQQEDVLNELNKNQNAVNRRIAELEEGHKVEGGTHNPTGYCPTCETIKKLENLK